MQTRFIPGLTKESQGLYEKYKKQCSNILFSDSTIEAGNGLVNTMPYEKKKRLEEVIKSTDHTHNGRNAWKQSEAFPTTELPQILHI